MEKYYIIIKDVNEVRQAIERGYEMGYTSPLSEGKEYFIDFLERMMSGWLRYGNHVITYSSNGSMYQEDFDSFSNSSRFSDYIKLEVGKRELFDNDELFSI